MARNGRSKSTLVFLLIAAINYFILSVVVLGCGFYIDYKHSVPDDYDKMSTQYTRSHISTTQDELVEMHWTHTQYWFGFPLLITCTVTLMSAIFQDNRLLNTVTFASFFICITLGLYVVVIDSNYWMWWQNDLRKLHLWEGKSGFTCDTVTDVNGEKECVCATAEKGLTKTISYFVGCSELATLPGVYGAITASAIFGIVLSLGGIVFYSKSTPWRQHSAYTGQINNGDGEAIL